jgi:hypothetical protein
MEAFSQPYVLSEYEGRAMAQAVSRRPLTAEARFRSGLAHVRFVLDKVALGQVFSPSTLVFPCQFHSTGPPLHGKIKKIIIFITGLHNKLQGCSAFVASGAGLFTRKKLSEYNFSPLSYIGS